MNHTLTSRTAGVWIPSRKGGSAKRYQGVLSAGSLWLRLGLLAGAVPLACFAGPEHSPEVYATDVEFLLTNLQAKAGQFFQLKGVDWSAVQRQFREEVKSVKSDSEHVRLCARLLARLRDGHASLVDLKAPLPDESHGRRWTGPRVLLVVVGEKVYVRQAFKNASQLGIESGQEVLRIDDTPVRQWLARRVDVLRDLHGFSTEQQALYAACHQGLADWEGTAITFQLVRDGRPRDIQIIRQGGPNYGPIGPLFPPKDLRFIGRQAYDKTEKGFGYIFLRNTPDDLPDQLDTMLAALGEMPGLILDMRANSGGSCDHEAVFGRFLAPGQEWRGYHCATTHPFAGPMVVIIDAGTASAGETVSGMFKEDGRAYMIGDTPTAGMSSEKSPLPVPSGLFAAYFSVNSNKGRFNGGRGIEGIGVRPHEFLPYDPAELAKGVDTQVRRAQELLEQGLPAGKIPYEMERMKAPKHGT